MYDPDFQEAQEAARRIVEQNKALEQENEELKLLFQAMEASPNEPTEDQIARQERLTLLHAQYNRQLLITGAVIVTFVLIMAIVKSITPK